MRFHMIMVTMQRILKTKQMAQSTPQYLSNAVVGCLLIAILLPSLDVQQTLTRPDALPKGTTPVIMIAWLAMVV